MGKGAVNWPVFLLVLSTFQVTLAGWCQNGWASYVNSFCYKAIPSSVQAGSQCQARYWCGLLGADLVSIADNAEQAFVQTLSTNDATTGDYWISLMKSSPVIFSPTYFLDGNPSPYRNWNAFQPNLDDTCVYMQSGVGKWADQYCDVTMGYICKKAASNVMPPEMTLGIVMGVIGAVMLLLLCTICCCRHCAGGGHVRGGNMGWPCCYGVDGQMGCCNAECPCCSGCSNMDTNVGCSDVICPSCGCGPEGSCNCCPQAWGNTTQQNACVQEPNFNLGQNYVTSYGDMGTTSKIQVTLPPPIGGRPYQM